MKEVVVEWMVWGEMHGRILSFFSLPYQAGSGKVLAYCSHFPVPYCRRSLLSSKRSMHGHSTRSWPSTFLSVTLRMLLEASLTMCRV